MRRVFLGLVIGLLVFQPGVVKAGGLGKMVGEEPVADGLLLKFEQGRMKISKITEGIIRVRATDKDKFERDQSFALSPDAPLPKRISYQRQGENLVFGTEQIKVLVNSLGGKITIMSKAGEVLLDESQASGIFFEGDKPGVIRKIFAEEHFYGFGEKTGPFDKLGQRMVMWNRDKLYIKDEEPIYQSHPFYISLCKGMAYGVFLDNSYSSVFDVGKSSSGEFFYQADGGELNYYFIYGPSPNEVIQGYASLVGKYPLPPLWALGYHQCRYSYRNEQRIRAITTKFRKYHIPLDAIYFDIHYMDDYKVFTFNKKRFPDPKGLISDLEEQGIKAVVIVDPGVKIEPGYFVYEQGMEKDYFVRRKDGGYFTARVWPKDVYFPDFLKPEVRDWWGELHKFYLDLGVDGIWNDMNEPAGWVKDIRPLPDLMIPSGKPAWLEMVHGEKDAPEPHAKIHNVYALLEADATYNGLKRLNPEQRPFVISRAGYSGLQRFSSVWTGDNTANWYQVKMTLSMLLNLNLSGIVMSGADIGGFLGAPGPEMFARWIQQGVFYPFSRAHTAIYHQSQDPFSFGKEVREISKSAIELRYQLLPYTYSYFRVANDTGLPIMRAMLLEFPKDEKTYSISDQFFWGEWILVAPVVEKNLKDRKIYLPAGKWYKWQSAEQIDGGKEIMEPVDLSSLPILVKAGAIIPLAPVMNYTWEKPWAPLALGFYPARAKSCFSLYEDDGTSFKYLEGESLSTTYCQEPIAGGYLITKSDGKGKYQPVARELALKIFGTDQPGKVELLTNGSQENLVYQYDSEKRVLELKLKDRIKGFQIRISYKK